MNSVNVEGWALYAEAEVKPYLPLDGQLAALQSRLTAGRPGAHRSRPAAAAGSPARRRPASCARTSASPRGWPSRRCERYTFRSPGQATAYFCGYTRLMELRQETERALGPKFDRRTYHDFLLAQGLLPPSLLRKAVFEEFIPQQLKK